METPIWFSIEPMMSSEDARGMCRDYLSLGVLNSSRKPIILARSRLFGAPNWRTSANHNPSTATRITDLREDLLFARKTLLEYRVLNEVDQAQIPSAASSWSGRSGHPGEKTQDQYR
jgi:hypothetical protein